MYRYALIIFLSAFLLFQVQPIIAKFILPWFGGTANVWTASLLFFQVVLLCGYSYAHLLNRYLTTYQQAVTHAVLVGMALYFLPITPDELLKPAADDNPLAKILLVLLFTVGIPYWLLSASGPLFQRFFEHRFSGYSTYRLYALSNVGSLLGLLSYPFLMEPLFSLKTQAYTWSFGFLLYFAACVSILFSLRKNKLGKVNLKKETTDLYVPITWFNRVLWVLLAGIASSLLLASTNQICLDIASVPLLWVLPLSLYLISFIICFDRASWYRRRVWIPLLVISIAFGLFVLLRNSDPSILFQVMTYASILFTGCMACHGELARIKPHPAKLTEYYLLLSAGGALGGIFVSLLAPHVFSGYWELHITWVLALIVVGACIFRDIQFASRARVYTLQVGWAAFCALVCVTLLTDISIRKDNVIYANRNFYGVLRVKDVDHDDAVSENKETVRQLVNGTILHGAQLLEGDTLKFKPVSYYAENGGIGTAINAHPDYLSGSDSFSVGVVGMGAAAISALCKRCSNIRFYEINPDVVDVSKKYFGYLSGLDRLNISWSVALGDARISIERELLQANNEPFDVLAVDAFSGDAIPIHLLTIEAFERYWQRLKADGILAIHVSNRHLDLIPVVMNAGKALDKKVLVVNNKADSDRAIEAATWVLLTDNRGFLSTREHRKLLAKADTNIPLWTDDYSNIVKILK